jgi:hypothetical protein
MKARNFGTIKISRRPAIPELFLCLRSRDSAVDIATGYGLDDKRDWSLSFGGGKNFQFSMLSRPALGSTQLPIQWVPGFFLRVKRPGRETDHSPPTSAEVKKMWIYTSTPPIRLHGVELN